MAKIRSKTGSTLIISALLVPQFSLAIKKGPISGPELDSNVMVKKCEKSMLPADDFLAMAIRNTSEKVELIPIGLLPSETPGQESKLVHLQVPVTRYKQIKVAAGNKAKKLINQILSNPTEALGELKRNAKSVSYTVSPETKQLIQLVKEQVGGRESQNGKLSPIRSIKNLDIEIRDLNSAVNQLIPKTGFLSRFTGSRTKVKAVAKVDEMMMEIADKVNQNSLALLDHEDILNRALVTLKESQTGLQEAILESKTLFDIIDEQMNSDGFKILKESSNPLEREAVQTITEVALLLSEKYADQSTLYLRNQALETQARILVDNIWRANHQATRTLNVVLALKAADLLVTMTQNQIIASLDSSQMLRQEARTEQSQILQRFQKIFKKQTALETSIYDPEDVKKSAENLKLLYDSYHNEMPERISAIEEAGTSMLDTIGKLTYLANRISVSETPKLEHDQN